MKNIIPSLISQVITGRHLWKKLVKKNNINLEYDFVLILSKNNEQCAYYTVLYLKLYMPF